MSDFLLAKEFVCIYLQDGGGLDGADTAVGIVGGEAIGEEAGEGGDCEVFFEDAGESLCWCWWR
jgi:hypothetical protein